MSQDSFEALREELESTRAELVGARAELRSARDEIAVMEMSRFWKLRNLWWKVRLRIGKLWVRSAPAAVSGAGPAASVWLTTGEKAQGPPALAESVEVFVSCPEGDAAAHACVDSAIRRTRPPARVIPVPDAAEMVRLASASPARWVALVDAPVEFPEDWLERLVAALAAQPRAVAAAPLCRGTPGMETAWDRAREVLPRFPEFAARVALESAQLRPRAGRVPAGVLVVRREALAAAPGSSDLAGIARFLEEHGGPVLLADDVAVDVKSGQGGGSAPACRIFAGVASRLAALADVETARQAGRRYEGKRVLFVLPVMDRGGGANIVLREGRAMAEMGVDARVVNLRECEGAFRRSYPEPEIPVTFAHPGEIPRLARDFDAVIATANTSVEWLTPLAAAPVRPVLGYYVQDFEPYFYAAGSASRAKALASYTLLPELVRFAKTDWNARRVREECGVPCAVVGPSFETSLFRPTAPRPAAPPLRVAAMIRPSSPRRQPGLTLRVLGEVWKRHGKAVEIVLFGETRYPDGRPVEAAFPHEHLGMLDAGALARLFNEVHVFCDFSSYQAMGLTAMEAMACGATAILPRDGGATSFATDGRNALIVDTSVPEPGLAALTRLVTEPDLAGRLGDRALEDLSAFAPERPALRILEVLFGVA